MTRIGLPTRPGGFVPSTGESVVTGVKTFVDKVRRKAGPTVDVQAWIPDGTADGADVTSYFNLAATAAAGGKLLLTARAAHYAIASQMSVPANTEVEAEEGAVVDLITPNGAGQTFIFRAMGAGVTFRNVVVDGSLLTGNLVNNRYVFAATGTSKASPMLRPRIINCRIENVTQSDGLAIGSSLLVWHGVYLSYTKNAHIENLAVTTSGHGCYLAGTHKTTVLGGSFDTGWGGVALHSENSYWKVIDSYFERSGYWSAGIDDMSQCAPYAPQNTQGYVQNVHFSGEYGYTAALRLSGTNTSIVNPHFDQCEVSGASNPSYLNNNLIVILTRSVAPNAFTATAVDGSPVLSNVTPIASKWATHAVVTDFPTVGAATPILSVDVAAGTMTMATNATPATGSSFGFATYQDPPSNITVNGAIAKAGGIGQRFVEVSGRASFGTGDTPAAIAKIKVDGNTLESVDASNYFSMGLYLNAQASGIIDCTFDGNTGSIHPETTAAPGTASPIPGAVGILGTAAASVQRFRARRNTLAYFDIGAGVPTTDVQAGFWLGAYTSGSQVEGNTLVGFYDGILSALNSGQHYGFYNNVSLSHVRGAVRLDGGSTVALTTPGPLGVTTLRDPTAAGPILTFGATSLIVSPGSTTQKSMVWRKIASLGVDMVAWEDTAGAATFMRVDGNGYLMVKKTAAPVDGAVLTNEMAPWNKTTAGAAGPQFKVKDSAGTVFNFDLSRGTALADTSGATLVQLEAEVNALKARLRTLGIITP